MNQVPKLFSDEEIKNILEKDLLELMGEQNMPGEEKVALYEKMAQTVEDRVMLRIYDALTDPERKEFETIIDSGDRAKTNEYLLAKDLSIQQMLVQEAMLYKLDMMSLMKLSQNNTQNVNKE